MGRSRGVLALQEHGRVPVLWSSWGSHRVCVMCSQGLGPCPRLSDLVPWRGVLPTCPADSSRQQPLPLSVTQESNGNTFRSVGFQ